MTTIEKVKSIQDTARKNGLSLNKKFTDNYLKSHSMFAGPQELADRIVAGMWDICVHGINNGFDGTCKSTLDGLSDIVVALTELGDTQLSKLGKYSTKADGLLQKELQARKAMINVTEPVRQCIESCMTAVDTMTELRESGQGLVNVNAAQFELLRQSREIFAEMLSELDNIGDTSSRTAQEKADAAIESIKEWRAACARNILTSSSVSALRTAKDEIAEWSKVTVGVTRKERVKEQHEFKDNDSLASIVHGKASLELLDTFLSRMSTEQADIANLRSQIDEREKTKQSKIEEYEKRLDGFKAERQQVVNAFQNGEFDLQTADRKLKKLKAEEDDTLYELSCLQDNDEGPDYLKITVEQRETIYNELYGVIATLETYKSDLVLLSDLVYDVDFNVLIDMLGGHLSERNQGAAIENIHMIVAGINDRIENMRVTIGRLSKDHAVRTDKLGIPETDRQSRIARAREKYAAESSELSPELAAILQGNKQPQDGEKEQPKVGERRSVAFSDDDR